MLFIKDKTSHSQNQSATAYPSINTPPQHNLLDQAVAEANIFEE